MLPNPLRNMARFSIAFVLETTLIVVAFTASQARAAPVFEENFATPIEQSGIWTIHNRSTPGGESTWQTGHIDSALKSRTGGKDTAAVNYFSAGPGTNSTASKWPAAVLRSHGATG